MSEHGNSGSKKIGHLCTDCFTSFSFQVKCILSRPASPIFKFSIICHTSRQNGQWREIIRFENNPFLLSYFVLPSNWPKCPRNEEKLSDLKTKQSLCAFLLCPTLKIDRLNNLDIGLTKSSQSQDYISKYKFSHRTNIFTDQNGIHFRISGDILFKLHYT